MYSIHTSYYHKVSERDFEDQRLIVSTNRVITMEKVKKKTETLNCTTHIGIQLTITTPVAAIWSHGYLLTIQLTKIHHMPLFSPTNPCYQWPLILIISAQIQEAYFYLAAGLPNYI